MGDLIIIYPKPKAILYLLKGDYKATPSPQVELPQTLSRPSAARLLAYASREPGRVSQEGWVQGVGLKGWGSEGYL